MTHAFMRLCGEGHLPADLEARFQATGDLWLVGRGSALLQQADHRQGG